MLIWNNDNKFKRPIFKNERITRQREMETDNLVRYLKIALD